MEEAAVKNMKLSRSKRKATSSQSQFIDGENRPISAAASGSSSSQPNTFGKESQDDCHMSEDEAAANKEFSFCIDKDVNRSSNEFYSADDASTPGKIDEKRSPIFKANGKRSPIFGDSGKRSPIFELNGNRSPIFEDSGKRSPIFEFRGKRSPIFEDNGKRSPIFEDNGNRSPIFEYSGNRSPMFEDIGNRSPIFEDSTYSPGSGVVCNGDDGGQGSANSSKGSEGSKNGTKRSSVEAESSTLKKIRLNNSEESLKTEGNPGDITVTKHSAEDVDLFDESLNLPNTTEYFSELEKSVLEQVSSLVHKELDAEVMSQGGISMEHLQKSNVCPLCLKSFDRIVPHVKSCAAKKKVGTDKLFEAIKLQLKQHQEREAMGLPPLVQQPALKKKSKVKATVSVPEGYDSSLELAKALSESAAMESQDSYVCNSEANSSSGSSDTTKKTASIFGPASSNVSSCTSILKGGSSLLFNRSDEDRERIVTEKVAIVLLHSDEQDNLINESAPVIPSSSKMKENLNKEGILWERAASETTVAADYYVASLAQFVAPSSTARVGRLLRRVSQLPGRPKSPSPPTTPPPSPPPPPLSQSPEML